MNLLDVIPAKLKSSEQRLARAASYFALLGLLLFALSLFHPKPLTVILSMSAGHILGFLAVLLYLVAIVLDTRRASQSRANSDAATSTSMQGDENSPDPQG